MIALLRSAVLVMLAGLWTGVVSAFVILGYPFFPEGENTVHKVAQKWARGILRLSGVEVEVRGAENILPDRPQIFMANHQSFFDIFIVLAFIPAQFRFIAKKELFRVPIFGSALRRYGTIEIDRQHHASAVRSIGEAARKIREGKSVVTFPEGTRSPTARSRISRRAFSTSPRWPVFPSFPFRSSGAGRYCPSILSRSVREKSSWSSTNQWKRRPIPRKEGVNSSRKSGMWS